MSKDFLPGVVKAYGHICGDQVQIGERNTSVILKYCRQFLADVEEELPEDVLAHASRLLILVSMYSKELGQETRDVEMIYVGLLLNTSNSRLLDEFLVLGELLVKLLEGVKSRGPQVLQDGFIEMPFGGFEVANLKPAKVNVAVNSLARLFSLMTMWCNVFTLFRSEGMGVKQLRFSLCVNVSPFKYLGTLGAMFQLGYMYADARDMMAMCECLAVIGQSAEIPTWATAGLLEGITGYLGVRLRKPVGESDTIDRGGLVVLQRIGKAFAVIAGRAAGAIFKPDVNEVISRSLTKFLSEHVVDRKEAIRSSRSGDGASPIVGEVEHREGEDAKKSSQEQARDDVLSLTAHLLQYTQDCVLADLSLMPSLSFLAACCIDVATEHICARMVSQAVGMSPLLCSTLRAHIGKEATVQGHGQSSHGRSSSSSSVSSGRNDATVMDLTGDDEEEEGNSRGASSRKRKKPGNYSSPAEGATNVNTNMNSAYTSSHREGEWVRSAVQMTEAPVLLADLLGVHRASYLLDTSASVSASSLSPVLGMPLGYDARVIIMLAMEAQVVVWQQSQAQAQTHAQTEGEKDAGEITDLDMQCVDPRSVPSRYLRICQDVLGMPSEADQSLNLGSGAGGSAKKSPRGGAGTGAGAGLEMQKKKQPSSADAVYGSGSKFAKGKSGAGSSSSFSSSARKPSPSPSPEQQPTDEPALSVASVVASLARLAVISSSNGFATQSIFTSASATRTATSPKNAFALLAKTAAAAALSSQVAPPSKQELARYAFEYHTALALSQAPAELMDRWVQTHNITAVSFLLAGYPVHGQSNPSTSRSLLKASEIANAAAVQSPSSSSVSDSPLHLALAASTIHLRHMVGTFFEHSKRSPKAHVDAPTQLKCFGALITESLHVANKICRDCKKGQLPPCVISDVAHLTSIAVAVITHSFRESFEALRRCTPACVALKKLLDPFFEGDAFHQEPSARLTLVRVIRLAWVWRDHERSKSDSLLPLSVPDLPRDIDPIAVAEQLCTQIGAEVASVFLALRPHLHDAVEKHADFDPATASTAGAGDSDGVGCVVDSGTMTLISSVNVEKDGRQAEKDRDDMASKLNDVAHLDALCQIRTFASVAAMCSENLSEGSGSSSRYATHSHVHTNPSSGVLDKINAVADEVDSLCEAISRRTLYRNHAKSSRVVMLQAVCMLACSYTRGLVGEYSVQETTNDSLADTGMFDGAIEPAGRFSRHLVASQASSPPASAAARRGGGAGGRGDKRAGGEEEREEVLRRQQEESDSQDLISISAFARFCQHTAITNPVASVWALRHIVLAWTGPATEADDRGDVCRGRVALEELSELARHQILRYVMVSNVALTVEHIVVPLLLRPNEDEHGQYIASLVLTQLCARLIAFKSQDSFNDGGGGPQDREIGDEMGYSADFIDYASGLIVAGIVTSRNAEAVRGAKKKLVENQDSFGALGHITNLLDGQSTVLYQLLISSRVQQMDERDLVKKNFDVFLKECCEKLQVNLEAPSTGSTAPTAPTQGQESGAGASPLKGTTIQKTLLPLIWDLGATDGTRRSHARKALKVFCTLVLAGKLALGDGGTSPRGSRGGSGSGGRAVSDKLDDNISSVLPEHFLYIMSRLIQQQRPTVNQKVQSVYCLREIVELLRQPDLAKFLPKIISSMDSVLSSSSGKVRAAGVELTVVLINKLQHDTLCENLSSLVVALYPSLKYTPTDQDEALTTHAIPGSGAASIPSSTGAADGVGAGVGTGDGGEFEAMDDLSRLGQVPSKPESDSGLYDDNYIPSLYAEDLQTGLSCDMLCIFETAYEREVNVDADARAHKAAVKIIQNIFVRRRSDMGDALQTVAVIPDIPELKVAHQIHAKALQTLSMDQNVTLLGVMLNHESAHVRCLGLERLLSVIRDHKKQVYRVLSRLGGGPSAHDADNFVLLMLKDLLLLAAKESEQRVLLACAECLGELGAIDPALVNLVLPAAMKKRSVRSSSGSGSSGSGKRSRSTALGQSEELHDLNLAPWELSPTEMSFVLLENHLVPSLKGLAHMVISDKTGYAIQTMLHLIADFVVPDVDHSKAAKVSLPSRIREMLAERLILDVTEPFWYTRYRIQGQPPPIKTPIYYPGNSFNYWCAAWVRMLISHSSGVASQIFDTCKGIYRHRSELSQFVLPHVVVNYILHKSSIGDSAGAAAGGGLHSVPADIVWEICCVLRGVGDISGYKDVEDMIPALGEFSKCIAVVEGDEGAPSATGGALNAAVTTNGGAGASPSGGSDHMHIQAVFTLLDSLTRWTSRGLIRKPSSRDKNATEKRPDGNTVPQTTLLSALLEEVRAGRSGKASVGESRGKAPASRQNKGSSGSGSGSDSTQLSKVVQSLVDSIPLKLLTFAALRIKAYARALRYFELHARSAIATENAFSPRSQRASVRGSDTGDVSRLYDGSNYALPMLSSSELDLLMTIYSKLEDPDSIQGVQMLRQHGGHSLSPWHRIMELEQTDDWLGALLEYGLISDDLPAGGSSIVNIDALGNVVSTITDGTDATSSGKGPKTKRRRRAGGNRASDSMDADEDEDEEKEEEEDENGRNGTSASAPGAGALGNLDHLHSLAQVDRGRLRCLIELGHLDAATDLSQGVAQRLPGLEMALLPLGLEASWRLNKWDSLETVLSRVDTVQSSYTTDGGPLSTDASGYLASVMSPVAQTPGFYIQSRRVSGASSTGGSIGTRHTGGTPHQEAPYVIPMLPEDSFSVNLGRLFLHLSRGDTSKFAEDMRRSRLHTMTALSAASMESYGRAYPLLTQLHILSELERGPQLLREAAMSRQGDEQGRPAALLEKWRWDDRLQFMTPSERQRSMSMAVRRSLFGLASLEPQIEANWMQSSAAMRRLGQSDAARIALRNAEQHGLSREDALLNECRILKESGQIHKALTMLEPKEIDVVSQNLRSRVKEVNSALNNSRLGSDGATGNEETSRLPHYLSSAEKRTKFAEKLLLATQLMVESKTKHGATIIERFKLVTEVRQKWDVAHFELGRYCEDLYHDAKVKEKADRAAAAATAVSQSSSKQSSSRSSSSSVAFDEKEVPRSFAYISVAIQQYNKCINCSDGTALIVRALPRMLSLWFSFTAASVHDVYGTLPSAGGSTKRDSSGNSRSSSSGGTSRDDLSQFLGKQLNQQQVYVQNIVKKWGQATSAATWYQCMPQLVSRIGHNNYDTRETIKYLLCKALIALPQQSIWHLACLLQSLIPDSRKAGDELIRRATRELESQHANSVPMLRQCRHFFTNLIELAGYQHGERKMQWKWSKEVDFRRFLVPLQSSLAGVSPVRAGSGDSGGGEQGHDASMSAAFEGTSEGTGAMFINNLSEVVDVATSKAKPKTIYLTTTCGKTIKFLCKQEKNGDLRKDNRMMEVNHTVNRLLSENADGRRRNLRLRTYAVVCLNEECGILEWVNNTSCIRHLITEAHMLWPQDHPPIGGKAFFEEVIRIQDENKFDLETLVGEYQRAVLDRYKPCFHRWFLGTFPDPTAWLDARATFTRSCAVWSAVGHVVGLGDRHTENILLDITNGECVHVDFDCLFDKGVTLQRPEIVPFRLTPNMVDAMGLTGVEGTYRRTMEVTMSLLRENKDTLMSVLEPFLRDPTVAWSRSGRAQRSDAANAGTTSKVAALTENADAKEALDKIGGRLSGVYNIVHPSAKRILAAYSKRNANPPQRGLGAQSDEALPLSIQGQVARMIDEARSEENLSQMYVGWQPWA